MKSNGGAGPILVVGSVAFDHVRTPHGEAPEALGGAATYFSVAASVLHRPVQLVGVVGEDFPEDAIRMLESRDIDCRGLERADGKTFRWKGFYEGDMNTAITEDTQLNVFAKFQPTVPKAFRNPDYLFLANIHPAIQLDVLRQITRPRVVAADTMNLWISSERDALLKLIAEIDLLVINNGEAALLTGTHNLVRAGREILELGPSVAVIKKGEHGSLIVTSDEVAVIPAVPLSTVVDPTGAGDTFGGGMIAALASMNADHRDMRALRAAAAYGSVIASFTCESFSLDRILELTAGEVEERLTALRSVNAF